jgi:hypothetical protein
MDRMGRRAVPLPSYGEVPPFQANPLKESPTINSPLVQAREGQILPSTAWTDFINKSPAQETGGGRKNRLSSMCA